MAVTSAIETADIDPGAPDLSVVPALPRDDDGPVFAEPWEAGAFAMTIKLHQEGVFAWTEWVHALGAEITADKENARTGRETPYYALWLAALEKLLAKKGIASADEMDSMISAWRDAYLRTPHGQPVELE